MSMPSGIFNFLRRQPILRLFFLSGLLIGLAGIRAFAGGVEGASEVLAQLDFFTMGMGLLGGLALFLFGMEQLADALKARAGDSLKNVLARLTTNRISGALTGAFVTACVQSSSVTTVLVVGFITANIMSFSQSVGVIFGANIGSTVTAQIIAFKVTKYSLLLVAAGFAASFLGRQEQIKQYGFMCMGMGLIFLGMGMMSSAMNPLRSYAPFLELMTKMEAPLLAILVAAAFTGLIQSSAATTGIVIVMAGQGLISLPAGIALAFGANIGTCVTALLASIGKPREAVRASLVHILFNVIGVLLWVGLIDQLGRLVIWLSPVASDLSGAAKIAAETPRQIANAHTVFNVINTIIFLPFAGQFARIVEYLLPDREEEAVADVTQSQWTTVHLDPDLLAVPSIALEQTRSEIQRMAGLVHGIAGDIVPALTADDIRVGDDILLRQREVDYLEEEIDSYLIEISRRPLNQAQSALGTQFMNITRDLEHIGDLIRRDLVPLLRRKVEDGIQFSDEGNTQLHGYHRGVLDNFVMVMHAFEHNSPEEARQVIRSRDALTDMEHHHYEMTHFGEITQAQEGSREVNHLFLDVADYLQRINSYAESIAYTMLEGYLDTRGGERKKGGPAPLEASTTQEA